MLGIVSKATPSLHQQCRDGFYRIVVQLKFPWITILLGLIAILCSLPVSNAEAFELKLPFLPNSLIHYASPITAHFTHWSSNHLLWDLLAFLSLGIIAEQFCNNSRLMIAALGFSALGISGFLILTPQEISSYRGLSGLCISLWVLISFQLWQIGMRDISITALILLILKITAEVTMSATLFAASSKDGYLVFWQAHLIAGVVTAVLLCLSRPTFRDLKHFL